MTGYLRSILLAGVLTVPFAMNAQDHPKKYYDAEHKDYHEWNSNENTQYHSYLTEKKMKNVDFARAKKAQQRDYWKWRHDHPDAR